MPFLIFVVVGFVWFVLLLTDPAYTQYSQLNRARREFFQFYVLRVCMCMYTPYQHCFIRGPHFISYILYISFEICAIWLLRNLLIKRTCIHHALRFDLIWFRCWLFCAFTEMCEKRAKTRGVRRRRRSRTNRASENPLGPQKPKPKPKARTPRAHPKWALFWRTNERAKERRKWLSIRLAVSFQSKIAFQLVCLPFFFSHSQSSEESSLRESPYQYCVCVAKA